MSPTTAAKDRPIDPLERGKAYRAMVHVLLPAHFVASAGGALMMLVLLAMGLWEMARGVAVFWGWRLPPRGYDSPESAALQMAAKGLEFLFLAPLGLLLVYGVSKYVFAKMLPSNESLDDQARRIEGAKLDLLTVKAFTVSLFAAVIAASMVSEVLTDQGLTYEKAICGSLVIIVLASYFFLLERLIAVGRTSAPR